MKTFFRLLIAGALTMMASGYNLKSKQCEVVDCDCVSSTFAPETKGKCLSQETLDCYSKHSNACVNRGNSCGWKYNPELRECLTEANACRKSGCGSNVCERNEG